MEIIHDIELRHRAFTPMRATCPQKRGSGYGTKAILLGGEARVPFRPQRYIESCTHKNRGRKTWGQTFCLSVCLSVRPSVRPSVRLSECWACGQRGPRSGRAMNCSVPYTHERTCTSKYFYVFNYVPRTALSSWVLGSFYFTFPSQLLALIQSNCELCPGNGKVS